MKSFVSVKNKIGQETMAALLRLIVPSSSIPAEVEERPRNKYLQEFVLNDSQLLHQYALAGLVAGLNDSCIHTLRRLGLSGHFMDEAALNHLRDLVSASEAITRLDLSFCKVPNFDLFIDIIDALQ